MEDLILFIIGYVMIGFALGSVFAIVLGIAHFILKGRRGDAYSLKKQDY